MKILHNNEKGIVPLKKIIFYCGEQNYVIDESNKQFEKAVMFDLYNDDCLFITIDYYEHDNDKYASFSKLIRKGEIENIDVIWEKVILGEEETTAD